MHDELLTFVSMMWVMGRVRAVMCWGLGAFDGGTAIRRFTVLPLLCILDELYHHSYRIFLAR
jgi:hypothetical protein